MTSVPPPTNAAGRRLPLIDAARGAAVIAMIVYHFTWDLRYFGYVAADVEGGSWRLFARAIATSFLVLVGVSLALATQRRIDWRRYLRRLALIGGCALAITVVTRFVFPDAFIFFGILHHIAVASLLVLAFLRLSPLLTIAGAVACLLAPWALAGPVFDAPWLVWLGLSTALPRTNDFVPVFPWFGAVLAGVAAARLWIDYAPTLRIERDLAPSWLLWIGRHSLGIYLLHQPLLFGAVYLASEIKPPDYLAFEGQYLESCNTFCSNSEVDADVCRETCSCLAERSQAAGLWSDLMRQTLTAEDERRYHDLVDSCRAAAEAD